MVTELGSATMKTFEQVARERPDSFRYYFMFGLMGLAGVVAALTGMSREVSAVLLVAVALAVNAFIWLRQNPTLKQIEKRKQKDRAKSGK